MFKKLLVLSAVVAALGSATVARAVPIPVTNYDTLSGDFFDSVAGASMTTFFNNLTPPGPATLGTLKSTVYLSDSGGSDPGVYTYVYEVDPSINNISLWNTLYGVSGATLNDFLGGALLAGWSYTQANAADGSGNGVGDFSQDRDSDGTFDWVTNMVGGTNDWWDASDARITFFYQSFRAPAQGLHGIADGDLGAATGYAPAPEPSVLLLLGSGLLALGRFGRRKSS